MLAACFFCLPLAAQRRPDANPFPDDDEIGSARVRSFSISGSVTDAQSGSRLDGVRVDLQSFNEGVLATGFSSSSGNFQFNGIRPGDYELIFDQPGYEEIRQTLQVEGPVFGLVVNLRRLNQAAPGGPPTVSVRELSIPVKAREAMNKGLVLLYQKSDYPGSIKQFQRGIDVFPNFYEAYAQIGVAYMKMNDAARSEEALRKSIELSKEHYSDAFSLLAALYSDHDRLDDAEALARKAVEIDANSWQAQSEMAHVLFGLKRPDDAEPYALAAAKLQPNNPVLHLMLANIHMEVGNDAALLDDLNQYLKLAPNGPFAAQARQQRDEVQQKLQNQSSPAEPSAAVPSGDSSATSPSAATPASPRSNP